MWRPPAAPARSAAAPLLALLSALALLLGARAATVTVPAEVGVRSVGGGPVVAKQPAALYVYFTRLGPGLSLRRIPVSQFQAQAPDVLPGIHLTAIGRDLDTFLSATSSSPTSAALGSTSPDAFSFAGVNFPLAGVYQITADGATSAGDVANRTLLCVAGAPAMGGFSEALRKRVGATKVAIRSVPLADPLDPVPLSSLIAHRSDAGLAGAADPGGPGRLYFASLAGPQGDACRPGPAPQRYSWTVSYREVGTEGRSPVRNLRLYQGEPIRVATAPLGMLAGCAGSGGGGAAPPSPAPGLPPAPPPIARVAPMGKAPPPMARVAPIPKVATWGRRRLWCGGEAQNAGAGSLVYSGSALQPSATGAAAATQAAAAPSRRRRLAAAQQPPAPVGAAAPQGRLVGPEVSAGVVLESPGVHLIVGQVRRGRELILLPFYVNCTGKPQPGAR